jgi:hypothetical protein
MMSSIKYVLLGLIIGAGIAFFWFNRQIKTEKIEDGEILVERIKAVKKLIVTEGYFSELYSYKEADKYFYDLISFEKKALLVVKGKAEVSYDLSKMDYAVDEKNKIITLVNVPAPEITVQPEIKYYNLEEHTFNTFAIDDYNKLNAQAVSRLKKKVEKSELVEMARNELERTLNDIQIVGKELGWKIVIPKT